MDTRVAGGSPYTAKIRQGFRLGAVIVQVNAWLNKGSEGLQGFR